MPYNTLRASTTKQQLHGAAMRVRDTTLILPSLHQERARVQALAAERRKTRTDRTPLLNQIVPEWLHRNDIVNDVDAADAEQHQQQQHPEKDATIEQSIQKPQDLQQDRRLDVSSTPPQLRTLHNMNELSRSSCNLTTTISTKIQTTLVVQASLDRVWILEETCRRWKDPIIVVVGLLAAQDHQQLDDWKHNVAATNCPQVTILAVDIHDSKNKPELYPVNHLRNVGLDAVTSSHVLVVDVDFVPSENLHETIRQVLVREQVIQQQLQQLTVTAASVADRSYKRAVVVPAFERIQPCATAAECQHYLSSDSSFLPRTFDELKACAASKDCIAFQSNNNPEGHRSTDSARWLQSQWYNTRAVNDTQHIDAWNATELRTIRTIPCFHSLRYEPYVVLQWCPATTPTVLARHDTSHQPLAPYYDERFHGYGKNKIEHVQHLRVMGYQFAVLPQGFLVHNPHVESKAKEQWNDVDESSLHKDMDELYPLFLQELVDKYQGTTDSIVQACHKGQ
jgi:hypothetical protein